MGSVLSFETAARAQKRMLSFAILLVQFSIAITGAVLYAASFMGYGWEAGGEFIVPSFLALLLCSIPMTIRDRRFFKKYWGVGLSGLRQHFPMQFFPAREADWLNPLGWGLFAMLIVHFLLMIVTDATTKARMPNWHADVGYPALIVAVTGLISALRTIYPPTLRPEDL